MEPDATTCLGSAALPATVAIVIAAGLALWVALAFNRLVRQRNLLAEGWSGIDVQLKRRHNLIPALVETVTGYARHERTALAEITALRTRRRDGQALKDTQDTENALTDQLKGLFALAESYPDLKASRNFVNLSEQLGEIEDQIQMARRYYNGAVRNYNVRVESFPSNLVAGLFGFRRQEFFEIATATERAAPKVEMP